MELKPGYKQTEVGVIPEDWDVTPFGDIANIERGKFTARPRNDPQYYGGNIPFIQTGDITNSNGLISTYTQTLNQEGLKVSRLFPKGTLFFTIAANIGDVGFAAFDVACPDSIVAISTTKEVSNIWLAHELRSKKKKFENLASLNAQLNINLEKLRPFLLPHPKLFEQKAIAEALLDMDALISSLETLITKKRHIKQGAMQELLRPKEGWRAISIGHIADSNTRWSFTGGPFGSNLKSSDYTKDGIRIIQLQNIGDGEFLDDYKIYTSSEKADELLSCNIYPGDILLSKMGDPVARACIVPAYHNRYVMCSDGIRLVPNHEEFNSYFIYASINTPSFRTTAKNSSAGSTRKRIGISELRKLELMYPSISEQTTIATILSDMDAEITALEEKLTKTRQLKQGMMAELLTGRIRLVDPVGKKKGKVEKESDTNHNWAFREAVVIAVLADQFGEQGFPLGRKRYTKLSYLLHRKSDQNTQDYLKKAAGPYNPKTKYAGPEAIAQKKKYMKRHKEGRYSGFIAASEIDEAKTYFEKWYSGDMRNWLKQFQYISNDDLEVLATVDLAMQEILKSGGQPSFERVHEYIDNEPEWKAKLKRRAFCDVNIQAAIKTCSDMFPASVDAECSAI